MSATKMIALLIKYKKYLEAKLIKSGVIFKEEKIYKGH